MARARRAGSARKKLSGSAALSVLGDGWTRLVQVDDQRPVIGICPDCMVASASRTCSRCGGPTVGSDDY